MGLNTTDDSPSGIERYLNRNPNTCFIAEDDRGIIGAIMSGHDGRRGFIYHTVVKTSARKQGVGSALVEAAMDALQREGISKVALVAFESNASGNAFWEKNGFTTRNDLVYRNKSIAELTRINI